MPRPGRSLALLFAPDLRQVVAHLDTALTAIDEATATLAWPDIDVVYEEVAAARRLLAGDRS